MAATSCLMCAHPASPACTGDLVSLVAPRRDPPHTLVSLAARCKGTGVQYAQDSEGPCGDTFCSCFPVKKRLPCEGFQPVLQKALKSAARVFSAMLSHAVFFIYTT